jgi:hypothetical protein
MPQINATVDWPEGQTAASVNPNPIVVPKANGATVIKWTNGDNVTTFAISGLDGSQFNPVDSNGQGTSFTTNDANSNSAMTTYSYNVVAVQTSSGRTHSHDPQVQNDA